MAEVCGPSLSDDLVEKILLCLLVASLSDFCTISKQWNSIICSSIFLNIVFKETAWVPLMADEHYLMCTSDNYILYYSFSTKLWKIDRIGFPLESYRGSAARVILLEEEIIVKSVDSVLTEGKIACVWDPFMHMELLERPISLDTNSMATGIMSRFNGDKNRMTHIVVALGFDNMRNGPAIQIYNSLKESWRTTVLLLGFYKRSLVHLVVWKGILLFMLDYPKCVLLYNIQSHLEKGGGKVSVCKLPDITEKWVSIKLVTCQPSVFLIVVMLDKGERVKPVGSINFGVKAVIVWELRKRRGKLLWKEIARMLESMCALFYKGN